MPSCVVKHCKTYTSKNKKKHGVTFYRFPKDPSRAEKWIEIIRKVRNDPDWKMHESHRVCSKHFDKNTDFAPTKCGYMKLMKDVVPHLQLEPDPEPPPDHPPTPEPEPLPPEEEDVAELKNFLDDDSVLGFDLNAFTDMFDSPKEKKFIKEIKRLQKSRQKCRDKLRLVMRTNSRLKTKNGYLSKALRYLTKSYKRVVKDKKIKTRNVEVNTTDDIFFLL